MALDPKVQALIEIYLKDRGTKQAILGIDKTGASAQAASGKLGAMEKAGASLYGTLARFVGFTAIVAFFRSGFLALSEYQKRLAAIRHEMEGLGLDQKNALPRLKELSAALESQAGITQQESLASFQKLIGVTKNVNAAFYLLTLAADASEAKQIDLAAATDGLVQILQGRATGAANLFGLELRKMNGEQKTGSELLGELSVAVGGFRKEAQGAADTIDSVTANLNKLKLMAGEVIAPFASMAVGLAEGVKNTFLSIGPAISLGFGKVAGFITDTVDQQERARSKLTAIWGETGAEAGAAYAEGKRTAEVQAGRAELDELKARALKAGQEIAKEEMKAEEEARLDAFENAVALRGREMEAQKQASDQQLQLERAVLEARLALTEEGSKERMQVELDLLDVQLQAELNKVAGNAKAMEEVRLYYDLLRAGIDEEHTKKAFERLKAIRDQEMDDAREQAEFEQSTAEERAAKELEELRRKWAIEQGIQQSSLTFLTVAFGKRKAFAIADAIMNTWRAANLALATYPGPLGMAMAAAVAAEGLANVQRIVNTNLGGSSGGGGRGGHRGGGRGRGGFASGPGVGMTGIQFPARQISPSFGSPTTNIDRRTVTNDSSTTIDMRGAQILDDRKLARRLRKANRRDRAKFFR